MERPSASYISTTYSSASIASSITEEIVEPLCKPTCRPQIRSREQRPPIEQQAAHEWGWGLGADALGGEGVVQAHVGHVVQDVLHYLLHTR